MTPTAPATRQPVEIILDLRQFLECPQGIDGFEALWDDLELALQGKQLLPGKNYWLEDPSRGKIRITAITVPAAETFIRPDTPFAVHSVLEPPVVHHACSVCASKGERQYGPFICLQCRKENKQTRLCDEHVVILDGSMASFCPKHRPTSPNGEPATFWCLGPQCAFSHPPYSPRVAWSDKDRRTHPHDSDVWYCPECYEDLFPQCSATRCPHIASNRCEFVDPATEKSCGRRLCNRHVRRWQIYGGNRLGLSLCEQHRDARRLSDEQIIYQVVAATAARGDRDFELPRLGSVRYILQKARGNFYPPTAIHALFTDLMRLAQNSFLWKDMTWLIRDSERRWQGELRGEARKQASGLELFSKVQTELRAMGLDQVATALEFSEYIQGKNLLFVRLSESLRGLFIGRGGSTIKQVQDRVGARVQFEGLERA